MLIFQYLSYLSFFLSILFCRSIFLSVRFSVYKATYLMSCLFAGLFIYFFISVFVYLDRTWKIHSLLWGTPKIPFQPPEWNFGGPHRGFTQ